MTWGSATRRSSHQRETTVEAIRGEVSDSTTISAQPESWTVESARDRGGSLNRVVQRYVLFSHRQNRLFSDNSRSLKRARKKTLKRIALLVLVVVLSWVALRKVHFSANPLDALPDDIPEVSTLKIYESAFSGTNDVFVAITHPDPLVTEELMGSLHRFLSPYTGLFRSLVWQAPWDDEPARAAELLAFSWINAPPEKIGAFAEALTPDKARERLEESFEVLTDSFVFDLAEQQRASLDPLQLTNAGGEGSIDLNQLLRLRYSSPDGTLRVLVMEPAYPLDNAKKTDQWIGEVKALLDTWKLEQDQGADLQCDLTGRIIYMHEITENLKHDLRYSIIFTSVFVVGIFWLSYRRLGPLFRLLLCIFLTFLITLLLSDLFYEKLSAMSAGFAAILVGLVVDYGFLIYQETCSAQLRSSGLRKAMREPIYWAAATTACVFVGLNLSAITGIRQLGTLVAIGIVAGAIIMIQFYTVWASRSRRKLPSTPVFLQYLGERLAWSRVGLVASVSAVVASVIILVVRGLPPVSYGSDALKPHSSPAFESFTRVQGQLGNGDNTPIMVVADSDVHMTDQLKAVENVLSENKSVTGFGTPLAIWNTPEHQRNNLSAISAIFFRRENLFQAGEEIGFDTGEWELTRAVFDTWRRFIEAPEAFQLESPASHWLLQRMARDLPDEKVAVGYFTTDSIGLEDERALQKELAKHHTSMLGWHYLNPIVLQLMHHDFRYVVLPLTGLLVSMLFFVFRKLRPVLLSLAALSCSGLLLIAAMSLLGWQWTMFNIIAIPLLLGAGLDYAIHIQLGLRRFGGDHAQVYQNIGRALLLCALTTAVGFGSLVTARHGGLPSLGKVCATGILIVMITSVWLLPHWWSWCHRGDGHGRISRK